MTPTDSTGPVPFQRRPDAPTLEKVLYDLQSLHGVILHKQHTAEQYADSGDAACRERWRAVAGAHRADAELVAKALGIGEGAVA